MDIKNKDIYWFVIKINSLVLDFGGISDRDHSSPYAKGFYKELKFIEVMGSTFEEAEDNAKFIARRLCTDGLIKGVLDFDKDVKVEEVIRSQII